MNRSDSGEDRKFGENLGKLERDRWVAVAVFSILFFLLGMAIGALSTLSLLTSTSGIFNHW